MPYSHVITATVMNLGVCQGHSSIACFFLYLQSRRAVPLPSQSFLYSCTNPAVIAAMRNKRFDLI